ncbi:MAG: hypothetical protein LBN27_01810 [Prevotellaceae bacterium]|nr:hypothetical protein [Prevotellaceae bacterium]
MTGLKRGLRVILRLRSVTKPAMSGCHWVSRHSRGNNVLPNSSLSLRAWLLSEVEVPATPFLYYKNGIVLCRWLKSTAIDTNKSVETDCLRQSG